MVISLMWGSLVGGISICKVASEHFIVKSDWLGNCVKLLDQVTQKKLMLVLVERCQDTYFVLGAQGWWWRG